jgi:Tetratricopeptide repeat
VYAPARAMADRDAPPPSSRDVAGEDFLYHLYRGSELLQDNRVHDAKAELEQALSLQPSDPKGQDLLGIVYFRLGLYPRAIAIYERLIQGHPDAIEPRINLALSYLKTGQPAQARAELEKVVEQSPSHARAWGYLGLAFQRMGDLERASHAFSAGGHDAMARRLMEMTVAGAAMSLRPEPAQPLRPEMQRAAGEAFLEIDRSEGGFRPDADLPRIPSGTWSAIEPGREQLPGGQGAQGMAPFSAAPRFPAPPSFPPSTELAALPDEGAAPSSLSPPGATPPRKVADVARAVLLVFPRDLTVARHASGHVLVQATNGFATRLELVRSMAYPAGYTSSILPRRTRGRTADEPLGGPTSPLIELGGKGELVLGPTEGHALHALALDGEAFYLREDALAGFESGVAYENGRLAVGDGEALGMVQLRGPGAAVALLPEKVTALEVNEARCTAVRAAAVLGWVGRVVPRALLPSEAPAGVRGFVAFAGEGLVFLDAR